VTYLLDVNVLIALIDRTHISHDLAHRWFAAAGSDAWATCPITQNGVIRIVGHPKYPNSPGSPAAVAPFIASLCGLPGHTFWKDELNILDCPLVDISRIRTPRHVTDTYLLALAVANGGCLATLDRQLSPNAVRHGRAALQLITD
jgi:toxin-antitoxin system PIN domain toxin